MRTTFGSGPNVMSGPSFEGCAQRDHAGRTAADDGDGPLQLVQRTKPVDKYFDW
jgi:hypothetical protein